MAQKTRRAPLSDAERQARRQAERELLTAAVAQLKTSEGWLGWLKVRKAFHSYSMNNQLLIALQNPQATRVAGFQKWIRLGRCVRKGEKAIRIFAPVPPNKQKLDEWRAAGADPKQRPRTLFKLTSVFDIAQVDALPDPAVLVELDPPFDFDVAGEDLAWLLTPEGPLHGLADDLGVRLVLEAREGERGAHGWYRPKDKTLCVYTDAPANSQAATAVHEFAHALVRLDRQDGDPELDYAREELVVESVAYSVLAALGVDAATSSIPYLASWSQSAPIETIEGCR
ncbi:MAG: ArdC-like ssDNA-binding domain-containing protein [Chloroflexota bacterium]|nr:ArdC-like ssDNA-binding domain-containing protein [Chloroflexota bacterium]